MSKIECAVNCQTLLGECVTWHSGEQALYWTDVQGKLLWHFDPASGERQSWPTPDRAGSFAISAAGGFVLALPRRIAVWDPAHGETATIADPVPGQADGTRLNDGRCDRQGRFVVGAFDETTRRPIAGVWRVELDGSITTLIPGGVTTNNSICFSEDGATMYFADTPTGIIWAYDYDAAPGAPLGKPRILTASEGQPGKPDGSAVDAEGYIWNAQVFGGRIARYRPDGTLDRTIDLPVRNPTSVCFGGPDLDILYITSLRQTKALPDWQPESIDGSILAIRPGVKGLPEPLFGGV